jgi:hypothetical protein
MPGHLMLAAWIGDAKDIIQSVAILVAGGWFLVQLFLRRNMDAAIEFDVEVKVFSNHSRAAGTCAVELAAVMKNATAVGAGVRALTWSICPVTEGAFPVIQNQHWLDPTAGTVILTRDTKWRLSALLDLPVNQLVKLKAVCEINWQPTRQRIVCEKVFSTDPGGDAEPGPAPGSGK